MTEASETARAFAAIAPSLPEATRRELRRQLAHSLAAPSPQELRAGRLGLAVLLVEQGGGELPTSADYDAARRDPRYAEDDWPSRAQLTDAYGDWLSVLRVALALTRTPRPGGLSYERARTGKGGYTRQDVTNAIQRARREIGAWPNSTTYPEWARLAGRAARQHGQAEPRIPSMSAIASRFGNWTAALEHAQRAVTD